MDYSGWGKGPVVSFCEHKMNIHIHWKVGHNSTAEQLFALQEGL
jgi:hypothetical protein